MRAFALPLALVACRSSTPAPLDPTVEPRVLLHEDGVENAYPRLAADGRSILYQSNRIVGGAGRRFALRAAPSGPTSSAVSSIALASAA